MGLCYLRSSGSVSLQYLLEAAYLPFAVVKFAPSLSFPVSTSCTKRSSRWRIPLLLLGLTVAVFTWGLQYKLSLYDPPQAVTRKMPSAKLLSADEQAAIAASPLSSFASPPEKTIRTRFTSILLLFVLKLASPSLQPAVRMESLTATRGWLLRRFSNMNAFFFLPPPLPQYHSLSYSPSRAIHLVDPIITPARHEQNAGHSNQALA